jgi:hypothetical protein
MVGDERHRASDCGFFGEWASTKAQCVVMT